MTEELSFIDFGIYKPMFDFGTSRNTRRKLQILLTGKELWLKMQSIAL